MKPLYYLLAGIALSLGLLVVACNSGSDKAKASREKLASQSGFNISLTSPLPPNDVPANVDSTQLVEFAWNEFFALNWQSSYPKDSLRDHPDPAWSYSNADATLTVWETYAHRIELRPANDTMQVFDKAPKYSYGNPITGDASNPSLTLFDNLDESSEIGSCMVFKAQNANSVPNSQNIVLYQAKANRAEYEYVRNTYPTLAQLDTARHTTAYNIFHTNAYYSGAQSTCDSAAAANAGVICLPCGDSATNRQGAIEVKTAWRRLAPGDTASHYLTRTALYYTPSTSGGIIAHNDTFALIALHIIHKTVNRPDFVFATFEHTSVRRQVNGAGFRYQLIDSNYHLTGQPRMPFADPIPSVATQSTLAAHAALAALNPSSVLQYYQLAGVQGNPTATPSEFGFRLANYVVESDTTLSFFHGSSLDNDTTVFNQKSNTLVNGNLISAASCQGCHGASQLAGNDFSFLLGQGFLPAPMPDFDAPLPLDSSMTALFRQRRGKRQVIFFNKQAAIIRSIARPRQRAAAAHKSGKK